tara:strand:+ start:203 stop:832 length:630 start_codon:yes stop_codon:yes gene_type:complete
MSNILPKDLYEAENRLYVSLKEYIKVEGIGKSLISANLKFEGLRLNPILYRLSTRLNDEGIMNNLIWPDMGATALAKRDMSDIANNIFSIKDYFKLPEGYNKQIVIIASPQPYDIEEFENLCSKLDTLVLMINGRLEDPAVGIGTVGRERRKRFNNSWRNIYSLEPLERCALMHEYPNKWNLFRSDLDGYRYCKSFDQRPDDETIILTL